MNIADRQHKADPFPYYARLRADSPVHQVALPGKQTAWLVTRYDDVAAVLVDKRFVKDKSNALTEDQAARQPWMPGFAKPLLRNMLDVDEPDHTRLRTLVNKAFTPRRVEQMTGRIQSLTDDLLTKILSISRSNSPVQFDLIKRYALPIPTTIIAELLGVPKNDRLSFARWSKAIVAANASAWGMVRAVPNLWLFMRYIRKLIRARQVERGEDLLSGLVEAEEQGEKLNEDELAAMAFLLLVAGHETTVNLIGNGVLALLEHPGQLDRLKSDPSLIKPAVEELLRFCGPLETATERFAREDVTIAGVTIPRGSQVFAVIASANRDESQFKNPDSLDISRDPNKHLSFGLGPHYCLGAPLARLEVQIAINTLLAKITGLKLAVPVMSLRWRRGLVLRGLQSLPVEF